MIDDLQMLQIRRSLIKMALDVCEAADDPHGQIPNYEKQLQRINESIRSSTGETVIGLKTADITAK